MKFLFTIFISSFLLFQIQPVLAKMALPFFGGGAAIWTACMLFFQLFLLLGYLYSHCLTKTLKLNQQVILHSTLVIISLFFMPITGFEEGVSLGGQTPQFDIVFSLLMGIGFPYFLLSSTAPLIQKWYSYISASNTPYRLYSLSNLASLLALLSYPFLIEPVLNIDLQITFWSIGYGTFVLCILLSAYQLYGQQVYGQQFEHSKHVENIEPTNNLKMANEYGKKLLWLLFSAVSVILMIATTSAMTQNIAPMPFLWILPLCIYLVTYIICFNNDQWYVRKYWFMFFAGSSLAGLLMFFIGSQFNLVLQVGVYSLILFFACMLCHGELARLKPVKTKLTLFYLIIALGGLIGSIFTSIVAEHIFTQYYEFPVGIALVYVLFTCSLWQENKQENSQQYSQTSNQGNLSNYLKKQNVYLPIASVVGLLAFSIYFFKLNSLYFKDDVFNSRNFYGTLTVKDFNEFEQPIRMLFDGATSHGTQYLSSAYRDVPSSYYRFDTGVSLALQQFGDGKPKNVGIIGLGTGTLAAYGNEGDTYVFYELNPSVELAAKDYFSYLSSSKADVSVRTGDARITLQNELKAKGSQQYQVLVVDAFSSDSIPVHLLTLEAFRLYLQHLTDDGLLVLHISNNHLDLLPLVATLSEKVGRKMQHFYSASNNINEHTAEWVVVTNNQDFYQDEEIKARATYFQLKQEQRILWTDAYSNLLSVIKF